MKKTTKQVLSAAMLSAMVFLSACSTQPQQSEPMNTTEFPDQLYTMSSEPISIQDNEIPLSTTPPLSTILVPEASGEVVYSGLGGTMDASNTTEGYIMCKFDGATTTKLKVMITGPSGVPYYYDLNAEGTYETFPFTDGNGSYKVAILKNTAGTKYSYVLLKTIEVTMENEFAPYLLSNQYVYYTPQSVAVQKAAELTAGDTTELEKVESVYTFVVDTLTYDTHLAQTVQSGYLPDIDAVLASKKGICFDYAALMTAMLRSQGVPTKLVTGFTGNAYHAWISTWSEATGWVEGNIFFDGTSWKLMDPTFASSANGSQQILDYIGDGANYTVKYQY